MIATSSPLPSTTRATSLRAIPRRFTGGRPAIAWSLALIFFFKGLIGLATVAYPIATSEPTRLVGVVAVLGILTAVCIWLLGRRISLLGFELMAAAGTVLVSAMVSQASTHGGMMVAAFSYPWVAIYAAHFFPRRAIVALGVLIAVGFAVGLLLSGLSHVAIYWVVVTATTSSICAVLGYLSEALRRQADTDPLTGLLNRNGFLVAANREHAIAQRSGNPLTLAVLDLDGFKQINDLRGHLVGDRLLVDLARAWSANLRTGDILARHGGDEFVVLLPATTPESAATVLDRLHVENQPVTWSVGIGEWKPQESLSDCLARADMHLYSVKHAHGLSVTRTVQLVPSAG